ncbi:MAG: hypothetical protein JJ975_09330 [Bacteroidia bacterium]|nr:hypothetical protein [Bacteroidia bacterium]
MVALLASCNGVELQRDEVVVLGHGGAGFEGLNNSYVPNSELSIKQALIMQLADGVEVDVQMTLDSQLVLFHDNRLEGITGATGFVSEKTWLDLSTIRFKRVGVNIIQEQRLWRLSDLLGFLDSSGLDVWLSLNIHPQAEVEDQEAYNSRFARSMERTLETYTNNTRVIVESPELPNLAAFEGLMADGVQLYYTKKISDENIQLLLDSGYHGFVTNYLEESAETVKKVQDNGLKVALYGVKIRQDVPRALKFHPDFVQTDNVPLTLSYLEQ